MINFIKFPDAICFSAGSAKGFTYIGILIYLSQARLVFKYYTGTSIGALFALLALLELDSQQVFDLLEEHDSEPIVPSVKRILNGHSSLLESTSVRRIVTSALEIKGLDSRCTLLELKKRFPGKFYQVYAVEVFTGLQKRFNHVTSPSARVVDAICASMALPILFEPVLVEGVYYFDGGLDPKLYLPVQYSPGRLVLGISFTAPTAPAGPEEPASFAGPTLDLGTIVTRMFDCVVPKVPKLSEFSSHELLISVQVPKELENVLTVQRVDWHAAARAGLDAIETGMRQNFFLSKS